MTKNKFITELRKELDCLPEDYVISVIEYYEKIFQECKSGEEEKTIAEWGIPSEAAGVIIRKYNKDHNIQTEETAKSDLQDLVSGNINIMTNINIAPEEIVEKEVLIEEPKKAKKHVLRHLICILTIPIWGTLAFAVTIAAIALAVAFAIVTIGVIAAAIMAIIVAIVEMKNSVPMGIMIIAVALCVLAIGGLLMLFTVWFAVKAVPELIDIMGQGIKAMFGKEGCSDEKVC